MVLLFGIATLVMMLMPFTLGKNSG